MALRAGAVRRRFEGTAGVGGWLARAILTRERDDESKISGGPSCAAVGELGRDLLVALGLRGLSVSQERRK